MKALLWRLLSALLGIAVVFGLHAQDCDRVPTAPSVIVHEEYLHAVFDNLLLLEQDSSKVLNILHIGDSHIQGNYFTDRIRNLFYSDFGLASKGLTFPFKLARTNSPLEIRSYSYQKWPSRRNIQAIYTDKLGITGRAILNVNAYASFNLQITPGYKDYQFDEVTVFYTPISKQCRVVLKDSVLNPLNKSFSVQEQGFMVEHFVSKNMLNQFILSYNLNQSKYGQCVLHGVLLKNSKRGGVNYHVAGVNGSQYRNWASSTILAEQSKYLHPDLVIISLGTNDANDLSLTTEDFVNQMHKLISGLRKANPTAKFLLTTPADSYFRRRYDNKHVDRIRHAILHYAERHQIACWDLYHVMGGPGSIRIWQSEGLAAQDLIHFSKSGYELQAELFYQAFIKHYKAYATDRLK